MECFSCDMIGMACPLDSRSLLEKTAETTLSNSTLPRQVSLRRLTGKRSFVSATTILAGFSFSWTDDIASKSLHSIMLCSVSSGSWGNNAFMGVQANVHTVEELLGKPDCPHCCLRLTMFRLDNEILDSIYVLPKAPLRKTAPLTPLPSWCLHHGKHVHNRSGSGETVDPRSVKANLLCFNSRKL